MKKSKSRLIILGLSILSSVTILNSCVNNEDTSIKAPTNYTAGDIQSYADLFDVFWNTMDQRYNYFYEQKRIDGMDWNSIYKKYHPKFKELKTFGRATDNDGEINEDFLKAYQYFSEIIDPIIDQHFYVTIALPRSNNSVISNVNFSGGMLTGENHNIYPFASKYGYMKNRVATNSLVSTNFALAGYLKTNPDIYYLTFAQFALSTNFQLNLNDKYLSPDNGNALILTEEIIDKSDALNAIKDEATRKKVRDFTVNVLNEWNKFPKSAEVATFNSELTKFKNTEIVSDQFLTAAQTALAKSKTLIAYSSTTTYAPVLTTETLPYISWFASQMTNHASWAYRLPQFQDAATAISAKAPFYTQFLNPLHKGDIKKIIIDLRGNGGGAVVDARFFSDRFITKNTIFGYQRAKEGNGQFNYTPWVEAQTNPHKFGIPANIPITILTDKGSASMSEITTLMLKSQGNHVVSIGDYSAGATAGLGSSDDFNGGTRDVVAGRLTFYMPLLAMKDANGEVIEGTGVKPNIYVTPPTNEELAAMTSSPTTFVDRVLNEAIKYLSSK
jgi:hypothetical protein